MTKLQPADPRARRRALLLIAAIAGFGVLAMLGLERWFGGLQALEPAEASRRLAMALRWIGGLMAATVTGFGIYTWRIGARVRREERFPPAGVAVVRDTRLLEGAAAQARGRVLQALGAVLVVCGILVLGMTGWVASRLVAGG